MKGPRGLIPKFLELVEQHGEIVLILAIVIVLGGAALIGWWMDRRSTS